MPFLRTALFGMQFPHHSTITRAAKIFICWLSVCVCIAVPAFGSPDDRTGHSSIVSSISQTADQACETADGKSASQFVRWNVKPDFLSRLLVVVLHQRGLSVITHPMGNLRREFSQPSLFAMGIALRL